MSPDGRWAIAGTPTGIVNVWEAATGRLVGSLDTGGDGPVYGVFDPEDSNRLYAAAYDGRVLRWDLGSADLTPVEIYRAPALPAGRNPQNFLAYILRLSRDGTRLGVSSPATQGMYASPTYVVDTATGALVRTVPGVMGDFSPDGSTLVTAQADGVRRWNLATGEPVGLPFADDDGQPKVPGPLATFSPDGRFLALGDYDDGQVLAFEVATGNSVMTPVSSGTSNPIPSFTQSGELLVLRGARGIVIGLGEQVVSPIATVFGRPDVPVFAFPTGGRDRVMTVDARIGTRAPSVSEATQVWDASSGQAVATVNAPAGVPAKFVFPSPDLRRYTTGVGEEIRVYQRGRSEPLGVIPYDPADPTAERWWSPDGRLLAVGRNNTVDLYRVGHGSLEPTATLDAAGPTATRDDRSLSMVFTPDSRKLAVVRPGGSIVSIFDTETGRRQRVMRLGDNVATNAVTISPDGRTLALTVRRLLGGDRTIVMFRDIETGRLRARAELPVNIVSLVVIRGGEAFATIEFVGSGLSSVTLWDATTFQQIGESMQAPGGLVSVSPTGDGKRLALGRGVGGTLVWEVDPDLWVERACTIAGRTLTKEEWKRFLPGRAYDPACR